MNHKHRHWLVRVAFSFPYAWSGIKLFFRNPSNAWIHLAAAFLACLGGYYFDIGRMEWIALVFAIASVIVSEMLNTAVELLTDLVSPGYNELAGKVKDIAAGAVLVAALAAAITGALIFLPRLWALLG